MDLDLLCKGLGAALETIPGLRVYSEIPLKINPPVALVGLGAGEWDTFGDEAQVELAVLVLVSASNTVGSQELLRQFISDGDYSVRAAVEADNTLPYEGTATADSISVDAWESPAVYQVGDLSYLGVEFTMTCLVP